MEHKGKRKKMKAMDKLIVVMEGTVQSRGGSTGGVQYTLPECINIYLHYCDNGVGASTRIMSRMGAQIENSFAQRAIQILSTTKTTDEVRAIAIPTHETTKDIVDAFGLLQNFHAILLTMDAQG